MIDAPHRAARPQCEITAFCQHRQQRISGLRFGADHATVASAVTAVRTPRAGDAIGIAISAAQGRRGSREWMIAELARRGAEHFGKVSLPMRRIRVLMLARRFKDIST